MLIERKKRKKKKQYGEVNFGLGSLFLNIVTFYRPKVLSIKLVSTLIADKKSLGAALVLY